MTKSLAIKGALLLTSALAFPSTLCAQSAEPVVEEAVEDPAAEEVASEDPDISIPGGSLGNDIVVVGRRRNVARDTPQVISVLSTADIERTGEGDIAGALARVTGLSVVGSGFVFVRGL